MRKVRTVLTATTAGLVFGILVFGSLAVTGLQRGLDPYLKLGYGGRYFVQVTQLIDYGKLDKRANELANAQYQKAKAAAIKKGETPPSVVPAPGEFYGQAQKELYPPKSLDTIKSELKSLPIKALYEARPVISFNDNKIHFMVDGKEVIDPKQASGAATTYGPPDTLYQPSVTAMSKKMLDPFTFPDQTMTVGADGRLPILIPYDMALRLLKKDAPGPSTPQAQRLALRNEARQALAGKTLAACLRNDAAAQLLTEATAQTQEIAANKSNALYVKPSLLYAAPSGTCEPVKVAADTRSAEEKKAADAQAANVPTPPHTSLVSYKIVGFVPGYDTGMAAFSLKTFFETGPVGSVFFPLEDANASPILTEFYGISSPHVASSTTDSAAYVEVASVKDYKIVMADACSPSDGDPAGCIANGKAFIGSPYGNPTLAIQDALASGRRGLIIALAIIAGIAALIMLTTIGKVMADSRQETGVFRAIGAKRLDIAQIYVTYTILLGTAAFVVATILATGFALYLSIRYGDTLTAQAMEASGAYTNLRQVTVLGFDMAQLAIIYGLIIATAIIASIIPLLRNVGRNPIKAMREG